MAQPKKRTEERSGNLRLASPPASLAGLAIAAAAARSEIIPPAANFTDRCKTTELQLDQAFCSQVRMNASSRIKSIMKCAQSRTVCVASHESRAKIYEYSPFFAGASSQPRAYFLSTAGALSMPMPGALAYGPFSIQSL